MQKVCLIDIDNTLTKTKFIKGEEVSEGLNNGLFNDEKTFYNDMLEMCVSDFIYFSFEYDSYADSNSSNKTHVDLISKDLFDVKKDSLKNMSDLFYKNFKRYYENLPHEAIDQFVYRFIEKEMNNDRSRPMFYANEFLENLINNGYDIYAYTNWITPVQLTKLKYAGLLDYVSGISSLSNNYGKPNKEGYKNILNYLKNTNDFDENNDIIFMIGDTESDIVPSDINIKSIFVNYNYENYHLNNRIDCYHDLYEIDIKKIEKSIIRSRKK